MPYEFVAGLFPPNPSYEQTSIFLLSCSAATIAAIVFSKSAPYRKPLYTNGKTVTYKDHHEHNIMSFCRTSKQIDFK